MRELKFRAWSPRINEFIDQCDFAINAHNGKILTNLIAYHNPEAWPVIIEQFTGLHDKYGKEIYEGDIVDAHDHNPDKMEIRFMEGGFCAWWGNDDYQIDINHFYDSTGCGIKIIGNIHENPELLK